MNPNDMHIFLASKSPRRAQLLEQLDIRFDTIDIEIAERPMPDEQAEDYVRRLAREKAGAGLMQVAAVPGACVIGSDTEVVLDGEIFGKPGSAADAATMLRRLSGREHRVLTAVAVVTADRELESTCISTVRFLDLDEATIEHYISSGEPFGKAGGYAIQGRAAAFIEHLAGSYSGVMGLPLHDVARLLRMIGGR